MNEHAPPHREMDFHFKIDDHGWHLDIDVSSYQEMLAAVRAAERFLLAEGERGNLSFSVS